MPRYSPPTTINIEVQEGNTPEISLTIGDLLDMSTFDVYMGVFNNNDVEIITKDLTDWVKDGQKITTSLTETDTLNKKGVHRWEIKVINEANVIDIVKGRFTITEKLNKVTR